MRLRIEALTTADAQRVYELQFQVQEFQVAASIDRWSKEEIAEWLGSPESGISIGAHCQSDLVGFLLAHTAPAIHKVYLENLFVTPSYRRQGLASGMIKLLFRSIRTTLPPAAWRVVALVEVNNDIGHAFFESIGMPRGSDTSWHQKRVGHSQWSPGPSK